MSFVLITGKFVPKAGVPDGDSVRFRANDLNLWKRLEGRPVEIGTGVETKGTVQLRLEGIDAIEKAAIKPLAVEAKQKLFDLIGFEPTRSPEPTGYVQARMTDDKTQRPICFIFAGAAAQKDGADVFLNAPLLRQSVNYKQMLAGYAYPLYYNTLFAELRNTFNAALVKAKQAKRGYWPTDATRKGVTISSSSQLETIAPIWPKLWRRLQEYLRTNTDLTGFVAFLAAKNERIDVLDVMEERGLQDLVKVKKNKVSLTQDPENLRVVSAAGARSKR
jgi:endonuclease YncB( thermonuclease family)